MELEYSPNYCLQLEAAYGQGMMSEGGIEGIEHMFEGISLEGKTALDIGCGLGGVAIYLSTTFQMKVIGLEVNPWMVEECQKRLVDKPRDQLDFMLISPEATQWNVSSTSCDLVYSKGVLTHVESKDSVFLEVHRCLKPGGLLVLTDWLSSDEKQWGKNMARLIELENLTIFPENIAGYLNSFKRCGLHVLSTRDDTSTYLKFNREIIARLENPSQRETHLKWFSPQELAAAIEGYQAIVQALETGELKVIHFVAQK